jgi:hypothetical protein
MRIPMLSAYLWDLRAQCEAQVRALTDAQRQLDIFRDGKDAAECEAALNRLRENLNRVMQANLAVRQAAHDAVEHAQALETTTRTAG